MMMILRGLPVCRECNERTHLCLSIVASDEKGAAHYPSIGTRLWRIRDRSSSPRKRI